MLQLRALYGTKPLAQLARDFDINDKTARHAITGVTWKHLPGAIEIQPVAVRRLSEADVLEMRRKFPGETISELSAEYGVCWSTAQQAIYGKTWSHLPNAHKVEDC